jgi:hypothetical protein
MEDVVGGHPEDRQLEHQNHAGDSPMQNEGTLCTAPPEPLPDLGGGETIMSDGDVGCARVGGGSQLPKRAAVGSLLIDRNAGQGCSGGSVVARGCDQNHAPAQPVNPVTPPHQTDATLRRNNFKLGPCEKRSRQPQNSKSLFFCRICQQERPKGTLYVGYLPVGETRSNGWQQCCADRGGAGQGSISCATQFDYLLAANGVLDAEERHLLEGGVTGAAASHGVATDTL